MAIVNQLNVGSSSISNAYIGTSPVLKAYLGTTLVYDNSAPYLTISADENDSVITFIGDYNSSMTVQYSLNYGPWTTITFNGSQLTINDGDSVRLKGTNVKYGGNKIRMTGRSDVWFTLSGNIMSLIGGDNFTSLTSFSGSEEIFYGLFSGSTGLYRASNLTLPVTALVPYCYESMFEGCTRLVYPPSLPRIIPDYYCCYKMFEGCTSLVNPAMTMVGGDYLYESCFERMYYNCSSLTSCGGWYFPDYASGDDACSQMYMGCSALTSINIGFIYHGISGRDIFYQMFRDCTHLTSSISSLKDTTTRGCFKGMFRGCSSLTSAPALPATTLASECYCEMFYGCSSLTTAPELPAATLVESCYDYMFAGCGNLN